MIDVANMITFIALVEATSFTEAARRLDTTKSVVSRRISAIETELGAHLLDRTGRNIRVTEVGAVYYAKCVRIVEAFHAANDFVVGFNEVAKGWLKIAVSENIRTSAIVGLLDRFCEKFPEIQLETVTINAGAEPASLSCDLLIQASSHAAPDLIAKDIVSFDMMVCASVSYLDAHGDLKTPDDLVRHHALLYASDMRDDWRLRNASGEIESYRVRERIRTDSCLHLLSAAEAGLGLAMLPAFLAREAITTGRLRAVLPAYPPPPVTVALIFAPHRRTSRKVRLLLDFFAEQAVRL